MIVLWIVLGIVVLLSIYLIATYNGLVKLNVRVEEAWSDITVQLKRRLDLIPNLVNTVQGYASHEKSVFTKVTEARANAMNAQSVAETAQADNMLSDALKSLFAVAEAYPDLKANQNFLALQEELTSTENKISFARQNYNDQVLFYNNKIEMFPSNIFAGMFNFTKEEFFEIKVEAERDVPKVKF